MTDDLLALARRTPVTRGALAELTKKLPAGVGNALALRALDEAGAPTAMVLAFAAAAKGEKLDPKLTRAILPEVLSLDQVGPLVHATEGGTDVLALLLEDKWGDLELECLALLLLADAGKEVPPSVLTRARWLARHQLAGDASIYLGGAALRLKNADVSALAAPHVNRAKRAKKTIDDVLAIAREKPLDVLPEADGARLSSGYTVKNESPNVGRNDPCPCGSGKKYKKCHANAEAPASTSSELDAARLGPDQASLLRPSEIAALDVTRLSPKAFTAAFRRVVDFRQWDLAERMLGVAPEEERVDLARDALLGAFDSRAREAAERFHTKLPPALAEREAFALECLRAPPDLLAKIEAEAEQALRHDADGARGMLLAASLLRWYPALGVYVARGALHEGRTEDSRALLEAIEDARDRLLLSPFEAWWDVYEAFFESKDDRREQKKDDAKREKLKADLRAARAASRKTAAELDKLQQRVVELDASLAPAPKATRTEAAPVSPDLVEERRRLKTKIDELQRIIGEGQDERRELRAKLAERDDQEAAPAPVSAREEEDDEDIEGDEVDFPRGVLVPRFSDRAAKAVADLAAEPAEGVLSVVAALAAGKPNAWGGVKQLAKVRGVLSARAGIHHRVLFAVADRGLEVLEVLHRRDLEQVVARLARTA
jgi:hypothetical protein